MAHHRKIDIQSAQDMHYLERNITRAARRKIDLHFPPSAAPKEEEEEEEEEEERGAGGDGFRARVEGSVGEYIRQTLTFAKHNITINGLDASPPPVPLSTNPHPHPPSAKTPHPSSSSSTTATAAGIEDGKEGDGETYEAYDARLAAKVQRLYAALETETMDVAWLRREARGRAAEEWKIRTGVEIEEDDRRRGEGVKGVVVDGGMGIGGESEMGMERWEDVKGMYGRGCEGLVGLVGKGGMTETAARCERAVRVGEVVEGG